MIYKSNNDLKNVLKKELIDLNMSQADLANKLNISRQQLNNLFNKVNFSFADMYKICNAIGYDLEVNIKKQESSIPD